ncbi:hypothetical protein ACTSEZ_21265, partial [Metabacillus sp. JX24]
MSNIIKRKRKEDPYVRIYNQPLQPNRYKPEETLEDLRSLGLLAHIMSLPEEWVIHKTQLQKTFTRKNVDAAWRELAQKKYALEFFCWVNGKKSHFYQVADYQFTKEDFDEFVFEQVKDLREQGKVVKNIQVPESSPFDMTRDFTNALSVQYSQNSTVDTPIKEINKNKKIETKDLLSIDNYQETLSYPENDDDKKKFITQ